MSTDLTKVLCPPAPADICLLQFLELQTFLVHLLFMLQRAETNHTSVRDILGRLLILLYIYHPVIQFQVLHD